MSKFILLLALIGAAYYYYAGLNQEYVLSEASTNPIPKEHFFKLWDKVALAECKNTQGRYNTTEARCRKDILAKDTLCNDKFYNDLPDYIDSRDAAKKYGGPYYKCITPVAYCNGVEVKTMSEVAIHCR